MVEERKPQIAGQRWLDRGRHVWYELPSGFYKCVLCGGVSRTMSYDGITDTVEELTPDERAMCPPKG